MCRCNRVGKEQSEVFGVAFEQLIVRRRESR